ncbi:folliculin-interacting protein 1-like isoform X2 [Lineus longissimus]|uniref:folliculin-interacting protein 1-like isoform X2 n=1 Tax=Lineus longissimus TaxID=88925 RepID=UPI002B4F665E
MADLLVELCSDSWNAPDFKKSQIRLVVFKDHDIRGRNILFDSKAIKKVEEFEGENKRSENKKSDNCHTRGYGQKQTPSQPNVEKPTTSPSQSPKISGKYQYSRVGSDTKMLGEMIFGSACLSYRGSSLKVHQFRCPPQLMFTHVFEANSKNRGTSWEMENYDSYSLQSSLGDLTPGKQIYCRERTNSGTMSSFSLANSVPVEIPLPSSQTHNYQDDSGLSTSFCSSGSFPNPFPSPSSSSSINSNSYNSLHRRWMRSHQTCLEYGVRRRTAEREEGLLPQHHLHTQEPTPGIGCKRQSKIGMGIVIAMFGEKEEERNGHFQNFFFSHITLFEAHVQKLRINVEKAFINKRDFVHIIMESLDRFRDEIYDLYTAPRLTEPVWLNMMSYSLHRQTVCHQFMKEFIGSVEKYETKATNFFISTLVTAVLTYHLAWIPTVTPAGAIPSRTYLDKHSAKWLDTLTKSHPYNPLWAQLSDLYGAIGFPPKICRTMVVGKKQDLICKLLYILSYFIRCSEVYENIESLEEIRDDELDFLDRSMDRNVFGDMLPIKEDRTPEMSPKHSVSSIDEQKQRDLVTDFVSKCDVRDESDLGGAAGMLGLSVSDTALPCHSDSMNSSKRIDAESVCSKSKTTASAFSELDRERTEDFTSTYQANQNVTISICDNSPSPRNYDSDDTLCSTTKSDLTVDLESSEGDIGRCKLSPLCMLPHQVEDTRHVRRDNPVFLKTDNVTALATVTSKDLVESDSPTKRYMRLPSKDEVVTNELDDLFDGHTEVGMICDKDGKFHGIISSEARDDMQRSDNFLPEAFQSMTDSQYSSGTYNSLNSYPTHPCSDQADSLYDSYQRGEDSLDIEETPVPVKPNSQFLNESIKTVKTLHANDKPTMNIAEILKQRAAEAAAVADTPMSLTLTSVPMSQTSTSVPMSPVSFCASSSPTPSRTASCFSPTQSEKSDDVERGSEICGSPPKPVRSRSRNNSGDKPSITRQTSRTNTPGRTRSVTPTELGRRRHASSNSAADSDAFDPFLNLKEMPMPRSEDDVLESNVKAFERNFGRSLLAGYSKCYLSDFVLHGTSDVDYTSKLIGDLELAAQTTVLDEPVNEAVCIVADADKWEVKLISSQVGPSTDKAPGMTINGPSQLVANLIESVHDMWKLKMSPDFCLMHLEDRLQEIYFKSRMLSEYMRHRKVGDVTELATVIGCDTSDLSLLFAVAGTHSPSLSFSLL